MAKPSSSPELEPLKSADTASPVWVRFLAVVIIIAVLLAVIVLATGIGGHGPGQHIQPTSTPRAASHLGTL